MKESKYNNGTLFIKRDVERKYGRIVFLLIPGLLWFMLSYGPSVSWKNQSDVLEASVNEDSLKNREVKTKDDALKQQTKDDSLYTLNISDAYLRDAPAVAGKQTRYMDMIETATKGAIATSVSDIVPQKPPEWLTLTVKSGDTLSDLFYKYGLSSSTLYNLLSSNSKAKSSLSAIKPGEKLYLDIQDGDLKKLKYMPSLLETMIFEKESDKDYKFNQIVHKPDTYLTYSKGVIKDTLFGAASTAKIPDSITMQLASIFGWDIDFVQDIRAGDEFSLIYEEKFIDGQKIGYGKIKVARFVNRGKTYQAIYYEDGNGKAGYYDASGKSLHKAFIRTPVEFTRISGRFNPNRLHPIFKTRRPHRGVDYAAPRNTPIKASGDGVIQFIGKQTGYGNVIYIKHSSSIVTVYAHQNKFARGLRKGQRVRQGQTIGYVGMTGWATGPHLHYEFRINGVHHDPLKVVLPKAKPLPKTELAHFKEKADLLLSSLDQKQPTMLALAEEKDQNATN